MSPRLLIAAALPLLLLADTTTTHAAWQTDGNAVCNASFTQSEPTVVGDATGGAYVVWKDQRPLAHADVYVQHLDTNGNVVAPWPANGLAVESLPTTILTPTAVSDGAGGVIALWRDGRGGIWAQRVNSAGVAQWPANGVRVANVAVTSYEAIPDGSGGVIVAWEDTRAGSLNHDIYARRLGAAGDTMWAGNGVLVCNATGQQVLPNLASDGAGGAIIAWVDERLGSTMNRLYAQRISGAGTAQWAANGVLAGGSGNVFNDQDLGATIDGAGGAYIVWTEFRNGFYSIFLQRMTGAGAPFAGWNPTGRQLDMSGLDNEPVIVSDGEGGCVVAGAMFGNQQNRLQRLNGSGTEYWTLDFVMNGGTDGPSLAPDGTHGGFVAYLAEIGAQIWAGRATGIGTIPGPWSFAGVIVSAPVAGSRMQLSLGATTSADAIAAWSDTRNSGTTGTDIYAVKLGAANPTGVAPLTNTSLAITAHPNPVHGALSARFTLERAGPASIAVIDLAGRERFTRDVSTYGAGTHTLALDGTRMLEPGMYFLALRRDGSAAQAIRFVVVK